MFGMAGAAAASLMTPVSVAASAETGAAAGAAAGAVALVPEATVDVCGALSSSSASLEGSFPLPQATMSVTANSMERNFFILSYLLRAAFTVGLAGGNEGWAGKTAGGAAPPAPAALI